MNGIKFLIVTLTLVLTSCVSQKKYALLQDNIVLYESRLNSSKSENAVLETYLANERNVSKSLKEQIEYYKSTNAELLAKLSDFSVFENSGRECIEKSVDALNNQNKYVKNLTQSIQKRDSINMFLAMYLKRALEDFNNEEITIEVKKGVVSVSISDKMLFLPNSYEISDNAENVIGRIAEIINDFKELDIMVEGHVVSLPIINECILDNWDLSVKRATTIVRLMQNKFNIKPERMKAGGSYQYLPNTTNETLMDATKISRTEIIIFPKFDHFINLLEPPITTTNKY